MACDRDLGIQDGKPKLDWSLAWWLGDVFMKGDSDIESVYKQVKEMGGELCSDPPWNLYWKEFFNKYSDSKVILTFRDSCRVQNSLTDY